MRSPVTADSASTARSCLPLKWWYMLPCPTPARAITSRGLVAAYPRSQRSSAIASVSWSREPMLEL